MVPAARAGAAAGIGDKTAGGGTEEKVPVAAAACDEDFAAQPAAGLGTREAGGDN